MFLVHYNSAGIQGCLLRGSPLRAPFVVSGSMPTHMEGEIQEALPWYIEVRVCQHHWSV